MPWQRFLPHSCSCYLSGDLWQAYRTSHPATSSVRFRVAIKSGAICLSLPRRPILLLSKRYTHLVIPLAGVLGSLAIFHSIYHTHFIWLCGRLALYGRVPVACGVSPLVYLFRYHYPVILAVPFLPGVRIIKLFRNCLLSAPSVRLC